MTLTPTSLPKEAKALPAEAQQVFLDAYNRDFGWRCSESHAAKAAWLAVQARWPDLVPKE
jgi:cation transport regulator ChaB